MILIALGASLPSDAGTPEQTLRASLPALCEKGVTVIARSRLYRTPAWPNPDDPPFVNAMLHVETTHSPSALMVVLHEIESAFGRMRSVVNAPRTLDLDLIDYNGQIETGALTLPHPRLGTRGFVLLPLADVAPLWRHPVSGRTVQELIAALPQSERAAITMLGTF
ncbi:MAG: 2-amino-4-hydroxy-6-hydroxymethyldihydropteridine diphosphokinase [Pseudomonadota bacterium]|nr:2-amino-4-hydroxy-6-hydroxymethyldihydropteridine diphosphokinase [Pseudomonadota bacterium]